MKIKMQTAKTGLAMCVLLSIMVLNQGALASHSWNGYHWARTSNPFTLTVVDSNTSDWQSYLNTSNSDWSASTVLNLASVQGDESSNARKRCVMIVGKIHSCNAAYGNNGWLGLASINITGGVHITQGSSKMNDSYFSSSTYNNPNERLHVMCQEVGHTFGLDHQSTDGSSQNTCMDYFSNTGANATSTLSTHPNAHDYSELLTIYGHTDSSTTIGFVSGLSIPFTDEVTNEPTSWGNLVRQSVNGRNSTYEKNLSNGSKTVTNVFWTEQAAQQCRGCDHRFDR